MVTTYRTGTGDILATSCEAIVNPINAHCVSGAGLARQVRDRYPSNERWLQAMRRRRATEEVDAGRAFFHRLEPDQPRPARWIVNVTTKEHWSRPSQLSWIEGCLISMAEQLEDPPADEITSIAVPPIGSGLGGLDWRDVRSLIELWLSIYSRDVVVEIYEPQRRRPRSPRKSYSPLSHTGCDCGGYRGDLCGCGRHS